MAVDLFQIARLNQQKENQKRDAIDGLMALFEQNALQVDTNEEYDVAIKNIQKLQGQDKLIDLVGNQRIKKLELEKQYNNEFNAWVEKADSVFKQAKQPYDPENPTSFTELMNDLTNSGIRISGRGTKAEVAEINSRIQNITAMRQASAVASDEKLIADFLESRIPEQDKPLIDLFRKTETSEIPAMRNMVIASMGGSSTSSDQLSPKDFYGLAKNPNAENIVESYQGDLIDMNTSLQQQKALADQFGMNSVFDIGTEGLTGDAKGNQNTNFFFNQKKTMANLISAMVPSDIKKAVEKRYSETMKAQFDAGTLKDDNGNIVRDKSTFNYMIGSMASKDGMFRDQFINDLIVQMEINNETNLKDNLRKVYPLKTSGVVGSKRQHEELFENIKEPARNIWKNTIKMWRQASKYNNDVNVLLNPANKILDDMNNEVDSVSPYNYQIFNPTQYLNNANKVDD